MSIVVIPAADSLTDRYTALADTQFLDVGKYANDWLELAKDADIQGRPSLAAHARERGQFYARQAEGEYIRLIEGSFSELIPVGVA